MIGRIVKTLVGSAGDRRVHILQRDECVYSFEEEKFYQPDFGNPCWVPVGPPTLHLFDSAERAESEARSRIVWLSEVKDVSYE